MGNTAKKEKLLFPRGYHESSRPWNNGKKKGEYNFGAGNYAIGIELEVEAKESDKDEVLHKGKYPADRCTCSFCRNAWEEAKEYDNDACSFHRSELIKEARKLKAFAEEDGSLSQAYGLEVIFKPEASSKFRLDTKKQARIRAFVEAAQDRVVIPENGVGMHINISGGGLNTAIGLSRLTAFLDGCDKLLISSKLGGREYHTESKTSVWQPGAPYQAWDYRSPRIQRYSIRRTDFGEVHSDPGKPDFRLEVKAFRSTTNFAHITRCVQFLCSGADYVLSLPERVTCEKIIKLNDPNGQDWREFLSNNKEELLPKYPQVFSDIL